MMIPIKAYAATAPGESLQPFSYHPGELGPEEVEIKVTHCAPITETFPMSRANDALEHLRAGKARYRIVLVNE